MYTYMDEVEDKLSSKMNSADEDTAMEVVGQLKSVSGEAASEEKSQQSDLFSFTPVSNTLPSRTSLFLYDDLLDD